MPSDRRYHRAVPDSLPSQDPVIHARGLTKRFAAFTAVDGVDFDVAPGEAFGLPRPQRRRQDIHDADDRGRLAGHRRNSHRLRLEPAHDGAQIRSRLGVVPQADTLDNELSVLENLLIYGRYFGLSWSESRRRAVELLDFVQLTERSADRVEPLSGGMKRRLVIARALINEPSLLLLDEPTTGLDPQARHLLWDRLYRLKQRGVTLCLTTHYMDEAEQLCDRLVVMDKARIVAEGSPRQLIERYVTREVLELRFNHGEGEAYGEGESAGDGADLDGQLEGLAERIEHLPDRLLVYTHDGDATAAAAFERGLRPASVLVRPSSLEDVFLRLTGRSLVE